MDSDGNNNPHKKQFKRTPAVSAEAIHSGIKASSAIDESGIEAEAEAIRIAAQAEAEANKQIAESLTPELLEKIKYEQWSGNLPNIMGGDSLIVDTRE